MSLNVNKWTAARREFCYEPILLLFWRAITCAGLDARKTLPDGTPADEALLARHWFATETKPGHEDYVTSFSFACYVLGRDEENERLMALRLVDGYELQSVEPGTVGDVVKVQRWRQVQGPDDPKPRWQSYIQNCLWVLRPDAPDFDTEECDKRLEYLLTHPLDDDDPEPIFEGYRVVPALDQYCIFG